jgi:hypothetical protein
LVVYFENKKKIIERKNVVATTTKEKGKKYRKK